MARATTNAKTAHKSTACASALAAAVLAAAAGAAVIDIPPGALPDETWFGANPASTVNIHSGGGILPGEFSNPFDFNGATVNIDPGGEFGWFTITGFAENCTVNLNGGDLIRTTFTGTTGTTTVNINSGEVRSRIDLQGNSAMNVYGGEVGFVAQGSPSMVLDDFATALIDGGEVDDVVDVNDDATLTLRSGSIGTGLRGADRSIINIEGGTTDRNGRLVSADAVMNVSGGLVGRDFVVEQGTVNMTGGAFDVNGAIVSSLFPEPVFNMKDGALGATFRAYDGTFNMAGGVTGTFRLGRPVGDGAGVTLNIYAKSLTIDGDYIPLAPNAATLITDRGEKLLVAELANGDAFTMTIRATGNPAEDYARAAATLNVILHCPTDLDNSGTVDLADLLELLSEFGTATGASADTDNDGDTDLTDLLALLSDFGTSCALPF